MEKMDDEQQRTGKAAASGRHSSSSMSRSSSSIEFRNNGDRDYDNDSFLPSTQVCVLITLMLLLQMDGWINIVVICTCRNRYPI